MISADALRKLLFLSPTAGDDGEVTAGSSVTSGFRYRSAYDGPLLNSVRFEVPNSVQPSSGYVTSQVVFVASIVGSLTMRARNAEKWWLGTFAASVLYYLALKSHRVENGMGGHQCAFFADALLILGSAGRLAVRSGSAKRNLAVLFGASVLAWYDIGRFHLWTDYVAHLRKEVTKERTLDLLGEYVAQKEDLEFVYFRTVTPRASS